MGSGIYQFCFGMKGNLRNLIESVALCQIVSNLFFKGGGVLEVTPEKKRGILAIAGTAVAGVCTALASGFFTSVGEKAGQTYLATPTPTASASAVSTGSGAAPRPAASASAAPSAPAAAVPEADPGNIIIDEVDLSFGGEGSAATRGEACADALKQATRRAENQCEALSTENSASGFELADFDKSCTQCGELSSGWRCVTRIKPVCKLYD